MHGAERGPLRARGERAGIDRTQVVDAALELAARDGAAGVSMRRIAASLGVTSSAVYWHVGDRAALLDAMVEAVVGELRPVSGTTAEDRLVELANGLRAALAGHGQLRWDNPARRYGVDVPTA